MRIRAFAVVALLTFPCGVSAQRIGLPRVGRRTTPQPATLPPEIGPVAQALSYQRSRWSGESYALVDVVQAPSSGGGLTRYTNLGTGARAAYRFTNSWSATVDLTASALAGSNSATAEVGTRFSPLPLEESVRPFVDLRGAFLRTYDSFATPEYPSGGVVGIGQSQAYTELGRYSRGGGGVVGFGLEYSFTTTWAITTELAGLRSRMTAYRLSGPTDLPIGTAYWATTVRYIIGFRFNPVSALHLEQKRAR